MCVEVQLKSTDNNGTVICSRLAGGGRGPSVDLGLVAVPFFVDGGVAAFAIELPPTNYGFGSPYRKIMGRKGMQRTGIASETVPIICLSNPSGTVSSRLGG